MMGPPVGKPLSPADARTVFLNLEQLAAGAEEMARGFEGAMGEEEAGPGPVAREGEGGTDRLGEVFMNLVSVRLAVRDRGREGVARIARGGASR
jgi:hypothetical protein